PQSGRRRAIFLVLITFLGFIYLSNSKLPTFDQLENPKYNLASVVYDANEVPFGRYYVENRVTVPYDSISPKIIESVLAAEDVRFLLHPGIDLRATIRVIFKTLIMQKESSGGGSTITQQLAKLLFDRPSFKGKSRLTKSLMLIRIKFKEWITAVRLEKSYTKEEILAMYLNKFEFIYGAHGIQAASNTYFGKDQRDLDYSEAATLIGMLKNPSLYNPVRFPVKAKERRNVVLWQLVEYRRLPIAVYDTLKNKDIDITAFSMESHDSGPAPYFRAELTKWLTKTLEEKNIRKPDGSAYNIYTDGLKIFTTIDLNYQKHAEAAVFDQMKKNQRRYWRVWRGMNPFIFEADDYQKQIRIESVDNHIINSDRYQKIKQKILSPFLEQVELQFGGLVLNEKIIDQLIEVEKGNTDLNALRKAGIIQKASIPKCRDLMSGKYWNTLIKAKKAFDQKIKKAFDTPVKMKVFTYNQSLEKDSTMTPRDSVLYHMRHLQTGMLVMESGTGHIKAWVGGVGFKYFKFDHINSLRQVGSTFKPVVYATAIAVQGMSPCMEFEDIQYTISPGESSFNIDKEWSPANADNRFTQNKYNLYHGLLYSKNSITVRLVKELGNVQVIRDMAKAMGIPVDKRVPGGNLLLPEYPAISLGAADISVFDMTGLYGTFANNGEYTEPVFVTHIEDKNGKVIYTSMPKQNKALNPVHNFVMVDMLKNNVAGKFSLGGVKSRVGGKTGTTNDYNDAWFIGITPNLVVSTWVGGDEKWVRFFTLDDGQGFTLARPVAQNFLLAIEKDPLIKLNYRKDFEVPADPSYRELLDCAKYKRITPSEERRESMQQKIQYDEFDEEFEENGE
ncbi:MAG TPA: peptidoglycan glycosyltransferase, partial [Saprospirales bacterium]|nr:peptidoglycan glycosyltransferase [Saprospirales bacterium]